MIARALLMASALGCGTTRYLMPSPSTCAESAPRPGLLAAVVRADITPPVGLSMFGHGLESRIGTGTFTRLECRGFVFREGGEGAAWVICDLGGISLTLQRRAAELVRARIPLGADRLVLTATHTHAGPSGFFESNAFLNPLGGTRDPFYDQRVTDFLATRIASAVIEAWHRAAPATLRAAVDDDVRGINRNRSLTARMRDPEYIAHDPARPDLDPAHINANRELPVLRVDIEGRPAGLIGVFGVHATALPNTNERYHGDLFAFARRYCESELAARYPGSSPICAIAPGTEGDASPDWGVQHLVESQRLGARLGYHLARLFEAAVPHQAALEVRYREVMLPGAAVGGGSPHRLARWAEIGLPAAGGAADGPTRVRLIEQMNPGMIHPEGRDEHGSRSALLGMFPTTVEEARDGYMFPVRAPFWWLRLGRWVFVTVPMEPTYAAGVRIRDAVMRQVAASGLEVERVFPVGLTGLYLDYLVTSEEYQMQHYEGASCVYGPYSLAFVSERMRELTAAAPQSPPACGTTRSTAAAIASTHTPPGEDAEHCRRVHPGVTRDGDSAQPGTGVVGIACFAPHAEYVRERWPDGLSVRDACPEQQRPLDEAVRSAALDVTISTPRVVRLAEGLALEVIWTEGRARPMCGASGVALVRGEGAQAALVEACRPRADLAQAPGVGSAPWEAQLSPCDLTSPDVRITVDDRRGFIEVWREFERGVADPAGRWHARFRVPRPPRGATLVDGPWREALDGIHFAVRGRDGIYHLSPPAPVLP